MDNDELLYKESSHLRRMQRVPDRIADAVIAVQDRNDNRFHSAITRLCLDRPVAILAAWEIVGLTCLAIEERWGRPESDGEPYTAFAFPVIDENTFVDPTAQTAAANLSALIAAMLNRDYDGAALLLRSIEDVEEFYDLLGAASTTLQMVLVNSDVEDPELLRRWARACHESGMSEGGNQIA